MLFILLWISVFSLIVSIYQLMKNSSLKFIVAPAIGLLFGYTIYYFALGMYIFVLIPLLFLPIIAMIIILNRNRKNQ